MIKPTITILLAAAVFLAMVLNLALKPKYYAKLTGLLMSLSVVGGLILYGYGFGTVLQEPILAVFRAAFAVGNMFLGKNEVSVVSSAPLFSYTWVMSVFWLLHLFAFYTTASAAFVTIGAEAMKKLRLFLVRRGSLIVVYGSGDIAMSIAKAYAGKDGCSLVYVTDKPEEAAKLGALVRNDKDALAATEAFWRSIGINGQRKVEVYSLDPDSAGVLTFAENCRTVFEKMQLPPEHTSLTMMGWEENGEPYQVLGDRYGFGHVNVFDMPELAARTAMQYCPTWERISFDEEGRALNGIHAMIIGFGGISQAMLKEIIINSQFHGADFKAAVFAKDIEADRGYLSVEAPEIFQRYDILLQEGDGRSPKVYEYLQNNLDTINYIFISVGKETMNNEVAETMRRYLNRRGRAIPMVICSAEGVRIMNSMDTVSDYYSLLTPDNLSAEKRDRLPILLNQAYCQSNGKSAWENWTCCDAFSRKSCRSAADFFPGLYKALGMTEEEAAASWNLTEAQKEMLGRHEHLRWCAFHFCNGFSPMTEEEWQERAAVYQKEKAEMGKASIRIGKNMQRHTHACLISWEALRELEQKEYAVTGKRVDYQSMDIANVMMIPELLKEKNR